MVNTMALSTLQRLYLKETGIDYLWGQSIMNVAQVKPIEPVPSMVETKLEPAVVASDPAPPQSLSPQAVEASALPIFGAEDLLKPNVWDLRADLPESLKSLPYQTHYQWSEYMRLFSVGVEQAPIMIVGIGGTEVSDQSPLVPKAEAMMHALSYLLGWQLQTNLYLSQLILQQHQIDFDEARQYYLSALLAQVEHIRPKCILVWGKLSQYILGAEHHMDLLRQCELSIALPDGAAVPIVFTHHPFYLSRLPMLKEQAWADVCRVQNLVFKQEVGSQVC